KNRWRTKAERRAIVEETLVPGASVSRVARRHDVNANQVFYWRKLYHEGRLGTVSDVEAVPDMIIYTDDTAEVKNERAFKQIIAMSKGELMATQKVSEVIKQVLADPTVESPIGSCITIFGACSAFTYVTACMLARSPSRPSAPEASAVSLPPLLL